MKRMKAAVCLTIIGAGLPWLAAETPAQTAWKQFRGMCDASAVEMLDDDRFVTANDEDNVLRVYSRNQPGFPVQNLDFSAFYRLPKRSQEIDLEGSARLGDRIYWISSHGANAKGKFQASRHRFFATQVVTNAGTVALQPIGQLYATLLSDLIREPALGAFKLAAAAQKPPKAPNALNIEGLAATPEGHLLIAFRNPVPEGKALLVPLLNPADVTAGRRPVFGKPTRLDLGGFGIRSITSDANGYLIVAGPYDSEGASRLYHWDGSSAAPSSLSPRRLAGNPEGIAVLNSDGKRTLFVLNDDGSKKVGKKDCKKTKDAALRTFRTYEIAL
jgi:hypothetical protein